MDVGRARRLFELGLRGIRPAEANVLLDGAVEQEGVLVHDRDQRTNLGEGQRAQVVTAQEDAAAVGIVEAQQQAHDRRLAAARWAHQAQPLAGAGAERQPVMHGAPRAGIGKAHVLELDGRRQRLVEAHWRSVGNTGLVVEDAVDALCG